MINKIAGRIKKSAGWIDKYVIKWFRKYGYKIGDVTGKTNWAINTFDFALATAYYGFSRYNIIGATPSVIVFFINIINLVRLIVKNLIEQKKITKDVEVTDNNYQSTNITTIHHTKICMEAMSLVILISAFCASRLNGESNSWILYSMNLILVIT